MLVDLKYHIVSLIAVFLSLSFGIIVGSTLLPNTLLLEKQNVLVTKLEKEFQKIKEENQKIKFKIQIAQKFEKQVFPVLIKEKIKGMKIDILEILDEEEVHLADTFIDSLEFAGAKIKSVTFIKKDFGMKKKGKRERICKHLGLSTDKKERIFLNLSLRMAKEISEGGTTPLLDYLKEENAIYTSGDYKNPSECLIIVAKERDELLWENIFLPFIKIFKEKKLKIVGCEKSDVMNSNISFFKNEGISTVDNIESIYGKISLVYILSGKEGNFGVKKTSSSLIPEID